MTKSEVKKIRKEMGYSVMEFSKLTGYHFTHIHRMERGAREVSRRYLLEIQRIKREMDCANREFFKSGKSRH